MNVYDPCVVCKQSLSSACVPDLSVAESALHKSNTSVLYSLVGISPRALMARVLWCCSTENSVVTGLTFVARFTACNPEAGNIDLISI
jgi:hypothetical protein